MMEYIAVIAFKTVAYLVLLLLSLVGNTLVPLVIHRNSALHTNLNYIIASMSISDLVFTLFLLPVRIKIIFIPEPVGFWLINGVMGQIFCKTIAFVTEASIVVSVLSLELISCLRLHAVVFPFRRQPLQSRKSCLIAILFIWTFAALYSCPNLYFWQISTVNSTTFCKPNIGSSESEKIEIVIFQTFFTIIPALSLTVTYSVIMYFIRKKPQDRHVGHIQVKQMKRDDKRVTYLLLTVVVLFFLPQTALCIYIFLIAFKCVDDDAWLGCRNVNSVSFVLIFLSYFPQAFTPFVYFFFNPRYRRGARLLCYCISQDSSGRNEDNEMVVMGASLTPSRENEGTERDTSGPGFGICQFHQLFIDRPWTEICFPMRPHDGKIMADSVVVEIRFVDECEVVFQDRKLESHWSPYYARADQLTTVGIFLWITHSFIKRSRYPEWITKSVWFRESYLQRKHEINESFRLEKKNCEWQILNLLLKMKNFQIFSVQWLSLSSKRALQVRQRTRKPFSQLV